MRAWSVAFGAVLGVSLSAGAGLAADKADGACFATGTEPAARVAACTKVLSRGKKLSREDEEAAYYNRGVAYEDQDDHDQAIADFSASIRLDAKDPRAYERRASNYDDKEMYELAIKDLDIVLTLDPKRASALRLRGNVHRKSGDYNRSVADLGEAIRIEPDYANNYYFRGLAHESRFDLRRALTDAEEAVRRDPDDSANRDLLTRLRQTQAAQASMPPQAAQPAPQAAQPAPQAAQPAQAAVPPRATGPATLAELKAQEDATADVWSRLPFTTRRALLVSSPATSFGSYTIRPTNVFSAGEQLNLYVEPVGFAWQDLKDDQVSFGFLADLTLATAAGETMMERKAMTLGNFTSHVRNREIHLSFDLTLTAIEPGDYVFTFDVKDRVSGQTARVTQPFTVK
ncbi:tetratricopeptide repeat protein [Methylobacterium sp. J-068]|uniref:tetratricopeptide repeat protein n=1 Tax=Methylobacterium sp. J-068 TaxID=2836649 RepID=UPI001FBA2190|nr:tetratricopeptide repeat protein [Methylobacterium sp. J-068]MCJ2036347.1 tetratricopeptide repeat protein [Methylobacterium sp. J-068]